MKFLLTLLLALVCVAPALCQEADSIRLTAKPPNIYADGATVTTITAEVRDRDGHLIAGDQTVRFSTTMGNIEAAAAARGGQASVRLTSSTIPGSATVTATCGHAAADVTVIFTAKPIASEDTARAIVVRADYLLYNDYEETLDAAGNVAVRIGAVTIKADRAQVSFTRSVVIAESQAGASALKITKGKETIAADRLRYDWVAMTGYASGLTEPARGVFTFTTLTMELKKALGAIPADTFRLRSLTPSPLAIRASRVVYLPGNEVQFSHARIMLNGKNRLTLPYHVIPLGSSRTTAAQYIGLGSRGPLLDIPYYVAASPIGSSQFRLKYNAPEGLYGGAVRGFALDSINRYAVGSTMDGIMALTRLTSPDWGLSWSHNQTLSSKTRAYLNVDTRSLSANRYALTNLSLSHQAKSYNLTFTSFAQHYLNTTGDVGLSVGSAAYPLPAGFHWNLGASVSRHWAPSSLTDPSAKVTGSTSEGVNARFTAPLLTLPGRFKVSSSLGTGLNFGARTRRSLLGAVAANRPLGKSGAITLNYNYNDYGYSANTNLLGYDKQTIAASLSYAKGLRWNVGAFATYGVEQRSENLRIYGAANFGRLWSASLTAGIFSQGLAIIDPVSQELSRESFQSTNVEARITRILGERSLSVVYQSFRNRIYLDYVPGRYY
ncbi:MAG TPA: invasin domain 3-containing protein [Armatimonadota bacterium]|jgi:hypothetical protein